MNIASEHDIIEAYRKHGSIKKVVRELNVGKERVRRLVRGNRLVDKKEDNVPIVHALRSRVAELETIIRKGQVSQGRFEDAIHRVVEAVPMTEPPRIVYNEKSELKKQGSAATMVVHVTDWHIGQTTLPQYIEEFGEFNYAIAEKRVNTFIDKILAKTEAVRSFYNCDDCVVIGTGDWVSGDIHEELIRTNEFPAPVQATKSGMLLGALLARLSAKFRVVRADLICAGNHDRITRKPQCEQGAFNSWGYIATNIAKQYVASCENVDVNIHLGSSAICDVAGTRYLLMHGDGIPAHMGVPHFGVDRLVMREALRRMNCDSECHFDAVVMGHWHVANNLLYCRYGGSLTGTTAFDHKYARHAKPHQTSWLVHPKHGEFDWTRWWL